MIDGVLIIAGITAGLIILFCLLYMLQELRRIAKLPDLLRKD